MEKGRTMRKWAVLLVMCVVSGCAYQDLQAPRQIGKLRPAFEQWQGIEVDPVAKQDKERANNGE